MSCETCDYYVPETNECWLNPTCPAKITQPDADCEYDTSDIEESQ